MRDNQNNNLVAPTGKLNHRLERITMFFFKILSKYGHL